MKKLILTMMVLSLNSTLFAMPNERIFDALVTKYPEAAGTKIMDCMTCHTINKWHRNYYGLDLENYLRSHFESLGQTPDPTQYSKELIMAGMKAIELMDSDGDRFSNLEELANGTLPGDETDYPVRPTW
ncbi:MAG: hypothetical protein HON90_12770 [Halobacteriovoraceae bacterium]|jgi:hypothetical protein|nr:hypothetical protein [Halobacteriovoraceae bacterium]